MRDLIQRLERIVRQREIRGRDILL